MPNQKTSVTLTTNTVFIPCAGMGSRIADGTSNFPKPLRDLGGLPAIARVISQYPEDWEIVVALGHEAELVKDAVTALLFGTPRLSRVYFVHTDSFKNEYQGLSHTLLAAREALSGRPFVFHAVDSILSESMFSLSRGLADKNQVFVSKCTTPGTYRYLKPSDSRDRVEWQTREFSPTDAQSAYIGIAHVYDHLNFWKNLSTKADASPEAGETLGLDLENIELVEVAEGSWLDIGSIKGLAKAQEIFQSDKNILQKQDEAIWFSNSMVIKVHNDHEFIQGRVVRGRELAPFVPEIIFSNSHTYCYKEVRGVELSKSLEISPSTFSSFLDFLWEFWTADQAGVLDKSTESQGPYLDFYREKTLARIESLLDRFPSLEKSCLVNGERVRSLSELCQAIPWELLATITRTRVHGDLHPENILATDDGSFVLLDWRQDMAGSSGPVGDVYYDLGKMAHGLRVDHGVVKRGGYEVKSDGEDGVSLSIEWAPGKRRALEVFREQIISWGLSWTQVLLVEAIVYLNIAPLHQPDEYSKFLAYLGRFNAEKALGQMGEFEPNGR